MSEVRPERTEQARLATLLEIGRSLSVVTEPAALRLGVLASLSRVFEPDRLFCSAIDADGVARILVHASAGSARRADQTYAPLCDAATAEGGVALAAEAARGLGIHADARGGLVVPIVVDGRLAGELGIVRQEDVPLDAHDAGVLAFGAAILGAALAAFDRFAETESRRREAERLEEIGRAITSSLEPAEVLERVMDAALDLTRAESCTMWRRVDERSVVVASRGPAALPAGFEVEVSSSIRQELATGRGCIRIDDVSSDARLPATMRARLGATGPGSLILVPMPMHDAIAGVLAIAHHEPQAFLPETLRMLERLALQAAIAIENASLHAQIRELSLTDPLTGLPNRRHLDMVLTKEFEAARRGRPLSVVLFDLDEFKGYNDRHGHAGGDAALRDFADILAGITRAMNLAVRYGGDEFLTVLSESTAEGAALLLARIEERVRQHPRLKEIGFSAGIAQYARDMATPQDLIAAADAAMYRRKIEPKA